MSSYLERRKLGWYAVLTIPENARHVLGKNRFVQSLKTQNKREADLRKLAVIAHWKAQINQALGSDGAVLQEALAWRTQLNQADDDHAKEILELVMQDHLEKRIEAGLTSSDYRQFGAIARGEATLLSPHKSSWEAQLDVVPKSADQMKKDVDLFLQNFKLVEEVEAKAVKSWLDKLFAEGKTQSTVIRIQRSVKNFWSHLKTEEIAPLQLDPFKDALHIPKSKKARKESWVPFKPEAVVALRQAAIEKGDVALANLIWIAGHTGARIEELCSLKTSQIQSTSFEIVDAKTFAGVREVPIHSQIADLITALVKESEDGYLLSGLTFNKYGDRSNAIGKRFGRLKHSLGFSSKHVFHSIRKTFTTLLENAGVPEGITADIIGHEKQTMTYGVYSEGATLPVKKKAIEKVSYPTKSV